MLAAVCRCDSALAEKYCVYAVSFDGFDGTGKITYSTAQAQAEKLAMYIRENCEGRLDVLFAESLGCEPAVLLQEIASIKIERMILSESEYLDFDPFNKFNKLI